MQSLALCPGRRWLARHLVTERGLSGPRLLGFGLSARTAIVTETVAMPTARTAIVTEIAATPTSSAKWVVKMFVPLF